MSRKREKTKYPNIYKYETKKGIRYQVKISYMENKKRIEFSKSNLLNIPQAKAILAEAELKISQGINPNVTEDDTDELSFNQYYNNLRDFKISSKKWNLNTLDTNNGRWDKLKEEFGEMKLSELTRDIYQEWINTQYEEHDYSQATMEGFHTILMLIVNDAVEEDFLDKNRLKKVNLDKEGYKPKDKMITMKEYKTVLAKAEELLHPDYFTMFYLSTFGLRRGEVNGIRKDAVELFDYEGAQLFKLYIGTSRTRNYPNGNKPKTEKSDRFIFLDNKGTRLILEQIERAKKIKKDHGEIMHETDFIFLNPETAEPYYIEILNDQLKRVKRETGINIHPHKMRHLFATVADLADADKETLRDFMGHATESMTKHYTHQTDEGALKLLKQTSELLHGGI